MTDPHEAAQKRDEARSHVRDSLASIKARLSPALLKQDVVENVRSRVADATEHAAEAVKKRPRLVAGVAAAATILLLRKTITATLKKPRKEKDHG